MKKRVVYLCCALFLGTAQAQDTFSIVAVDETTGEVGSAGASCIDNTGCGGCGGVIIISDLIPGRGAINAQASVCLPNINLQKGINWMGQGCSPAQVLDSLLAYDDCIFSDTTNRQYGIVDMDSTGVARSVGYTGQNALDYKNHVTGPTYAIQGNILLGQEILDSIEARFIAAQGNLACKLMAALQGANVPGADTRCLIEGTSSLSAFIRVAQPGDTTGIFTLDLNVSETPFGVEPIDSLQQLFDAVSSCPLLNRRNAITQRFSVRIYPNPNNDTCTMEIFTSEKGLEWNLNNSQGKLISTKRLPDLKGHRKEVIEMHNLPPGVYLLQVKSGNQVRTKTIIHQ